MARTPPHLQPPPYETRDDNVILGLFAREGYERHDTSRQCCDGRCNDNQGRGGCPRIPASMPKKAPRIPRQHYTPPSSRPVIAFIVVALCAVLAAMALVNIAARFSL